MDFTNIGSVSGYMKNIKMQTQWKKKKKDGDFQSQSKKSELQRKNEQFKAEYLKHQQEDNKDEMLADINNKVAAGTKLTNEEMRYLQSKNPALYQKLKDLENEKKKYEQDLKKCKSKEDVEKLKMSKVSSSMSAINSVKNNPNIPEGTKLAVAQGEMHRLDELNKITAKFIKSGKYAKLPSEEEIRKVESDIEQAKQNELKDTSETIGKDDNEKITQNTAEKQLTRTEAELTPEAQKIKRSKAKTAYKEVQENLVPDKPFFTNNIIRKANP